MGNVLKEEQRIEELRNYGILDTLPETEYDYIVELASAICDTPVSLINLIDSDRTWFKAKVGVPDQMDGTPRSISFCAHTLDSPNETLQIPNMLQDERFKNNPLVTQDPNVRFYAGSPLVTPNGHVLGTLCVIDNKPRELNETQLTALKTLAKKVMENLEAKRNALIHKQERDYLEKLLRKVSDKAPGAIFKFHISPEGEMSFPFISNGIASMYKNLTAEMVMADGSIIFSQLLDIDRQRLKRSIAFSREHLKPLEEEYRVYMPNEAVVWHKCIAVPEKWVDGSVVWFGTFQDITKTKQYISDIEKQNQILFEIAWDQSHVVRAPLSRILALANTLNTFEKDDVNKELLNHIVSSAGELDNIIRGIVKKSETLK